LEFDKDNIADMQRKVQLQLKEKAI